MVDAPTRNMLRNTMHNSIGASVSTKLPRLGTKLKAGYKWVSGEAVSRLDAYGESLFQMDPFLHVGVRLPTFPVMSFFVLDPASFVLSLPFFVVAHCMASFWTGFVRTGFGMRVSGGPGR